MRILVCGGRDFANEELIEKTLFDYAGMDSVIIQGEAKGADSLAKMWAYNHDIPVESYPANWDRHGKQAGFIRNYRMLKEGKPDLVIAFPGGRGTEMMVQLARAANVEVIEVEE